MSSPSSVSAAPSAVSAPATAASSYWRRTLKARITLARSPRARGRSKPPCRKASPGSAKACASATRAGSISTPNISSLGFSRRSLWSVSREVTG